MPIMLRTPPPPQLEPMARLRFIRDTRTRDAFCADRRSKRTMTFNCEEMWRDEWDLFWKGALPMFDYLLFRPAHWIGMHEPVKTIFGHADD
jgi:hypothetical protein